MWRGRVGEGVDFDVFVDPYDVVCGVAACASAWSCTRGWVTGSVPFMRVGM